MAIKDLRGKRFGLLTCIEPTEERDRSGGTVWRCKCDCGSECLAVSTQLIRGKKKSCGCLQHPPRKDLTGQRFGSLTVTEYVGHDEKRQFYWRCKCDCGNETVARQYNLLSGHTKSCGCLQRQSPIINMRLVDGTSIAQIEKRKRTPISSNTSGYNGVYWNKKAGRWAAQITFKGRTYYLGSFADIEDAVKARRRGEEIYDDFLAWYYGQENDAAALGSG